MVSEFILDNDIDVMQITETWFRDTGDEAKCADLTPPGYTSFSFPRPSTTGAKTGGGIVVIVRDNLAPKCSFNTTFPFPHTSFEVVSMTLGMNTQKVNMVCVYRPPPSKRNKSSDSIFLQEFPELLVFCNNLPGDLLLMGDFNVHYEVLASSTTKRFREALDMFSMTQWVTEPTNIKSGHTLDLAITRDTDHLLVSTCQRRDLTSDHSATLSVLNIPKPESATLFVTVRCIRKIDKAVLHADLESEVTPGMSLSELNYVLSQTLDRHAPLVRRRVHKQKPTPWYNSIAGELRELKQERRRAERRWLSTGLTVHRDLFKAAKDKVAGLVLSAKTAFYSSQITESRTCKELFKNLNSLLGKARSVRLPSSIKPDCLPHAFSNFFCEKIKKIRDSFCSLVPQARPTSCDQTYDGPQLSQFNLVSEEFVRKIVSKTQPKTCELDPMPTGLMHDNLDILLPTITNLINESLVSGSVPLCWKKAVVKPLLKKPSLDQNELKNYRPVSNLPYWSKILEKVILHQLSEHLEQNGLMNVHQSAYRANHSTETALLRILNDLLSILDQDKVSALLLLDLSAAFDTIDHSLLLSCLETSFGIKSTALTWFKSYLSDRSQFVSVHNFQSDTEPLKHGVPQGSVLGPVLFLLYTTQLSRVINNHSISHEMFADDTQIYCSSLPEDIHDQLSSLQGCFSDVKDWMLAHKLKLNEEKTEAVLISSSNTPRHHDLPSSVQLGSSDVSFSDTVRDLGFYLDSKLSLKPHIAKVCQTAYIEIRRISSIRQFLTEEATKTLVTSCILSRLDYCNSLLIGCPSTTIQPLQTVQNIAARLIFKSKKIQHCTPLLHKLHWLPVEMRIKYKVCCLCFKIISGTAPLYLSELLHFYTPARTLRSSADTRLFKVLRFKRKHHGARSFCCSAPNIWNSLPYSLRHSTSLLSFKRQLKTHLFKQHYSNLS